MTYADKYLKKQRQIRKNVYGPFSQSIHFMGPSDDILDLMDLYVFSLCDALKYASYWMLVHKDCKRIFLLCVSSHDSEDAAFSWSEIHSTGKGKASQ